MLAAALLCWGASISENSEADELMGNVPDVFEASFFGATLGTAPAEATDGLDMLTVALHELGHTIGVPGPVNGLGDNDYDLQASQVGGNAMAVKGIPPDSFHLVNPRAVMHSGHGNGHRSLLSATDVLAAASTSAWSQIDLPRKEFLAGSDWNSAGSWIGNRVPDAAGGFTGQFSMLPGTTLRVNRLVGFGDTLQFLGNLELGHAGPDTGLIDIGANQSLQVFGTTTVGAGPGE